VGKSRLKHLECEFIETGTTVTDIEELTAPCRHAGNPVLRARNPWWNTLNGFKRFRTDFPQPRRPAHARRLLPDCAAEDEGDAEWDRRKASSRHRGRTDSAGV
jgi:hypothetical protein